MSRDPFSPQRPGDFTRLVGTVADALNDLAEQLQTAGGVTDHGALTGLGDDDHTQYLLGPVASYSTAGFVVATDGTDRELEQTGVSADASGNLSSGGGDITTNGGDIITGPGLVDGRDVSADGSKLDGIEAGADVTDEANVVAALDGATLSTVTPASADGILLLDASDSDALKLASYSSFGTGDVSGPGSSTDNAVARWDGTGGGTLQDSGVTVTDTDDLDVPGDITVTGTVDGRDVAADGGKLDGIEAGADVTDATNVGAAGAVMDSDFGGAGIMTRLASSGSYAPRTLTSGDGINITNGKGTSGDPEIAVTGDVIREADFSTGMVVFTSFSTFTGRTLQGGTGINVANGNGQAGNPSIAVDSTVLTDSTFGSNGVLVRTGAGTYAERTITGGTGITVTDGDGVGGNPTIDADFGDTLVADWGDPTSTSSSSFFIGRHGIVNPGGNSRAFYRVPFAATLTRLVLVADVTAVAGNPRLGAIIYRATSPGGTFGLLAFITTAGTVVTATGTNITTDVTLSESLSAGNCLSIAYLRSGGTSMTVNDLRAFMTLEAT